MECRVGCGACCIAPSISSPLPGMPSGKPAGVRCIHLTWNNRCSLFGRPERPTVCSRLRPSEEMCGHSAREAFIRLSSLERATNAARTAPVGRRPGQHTRLTQPLGKSTGKQATTGHNQAPGTDKTFLPGGPVSGYGNEE
jgi:hypothetical protein